MTYTSDFYDILGIRTDATPAEVRAAYRRAALRTHPDKGGSAEDFRLANRAFEVLACPESRNTYDASKLPVSRQRACHVTKNGTTKTTVQPAAKTCAHFLRKRMSLFPRKRTQTEKKRKKKPLNTTVIALHRLRAILQAMNVKSRREVCMGMSQVMKKMLARFMTQSSREVSPDLRSTLTLSARPSRCKPESNATSICTRNRARGTMYQAQMNVKALRLYARPQESLDLAIAHQIQLSHLRYAIAAEEKADPNIWLDVTRMYQICQSVFQEMGTSEIALGLRAFVHIRAQSWLGQSVQITSASTTLCAALDAHARLLTARATSWEVFRAEWIQLMLVKGRLTLMEAEAVADRARQNALQHQVAKALRVAEQALDNEQRRSKKRTTSGAGTHVVNSAQFVDEEKLRPKRTRMSNVAFMGG